MLKKYAASMRARWWCSAECEDMALPMWPLNPHRSFQLFTVSGLSHEYKKEESSPCSQFFLIYIQNYLS